jgi:hypothetical protein
MEIKELSVPVDKLDQLKSFYRAIAGDERNAAELKSVANWQASRQPKFLTHLQLWSYGVMHVGSVEILRAHTTRASG